MPDVTEITEILRPDAVMENFSASNKKQLLEGLAVNVAQLTQIDQREIFDELLRREHLGSTALGDGVAIPHAKIKGLDHICGFFVRLENEIDFESPDETKIKLVFLLLAPVHASAEHLKALARVSRLMRDATVREKLLGANDRDALYAILTESSIPRNGSNGDSKPTDG